MAAYQYKFIAGFKQEDAQTVGELCEKLEQSDGGLSPRTLLEASREKNSPTHHMFEWDDRIAGEQWRLEQAASMIRYIRIVETDDAEERQRLRDRAYVSAPGRQGAYVSLQNALNNDVYREHLLQQALRDCQCFQAKYRRLEELAKVVAAMQDFENGIE